jgi:GDP-L-fucose synthase
LAKKNKTDLNLWGTGKALREFVYSKDLGVLAEWTLQNYDDPTPLILSVDDEVSIDTIAKIVCKEIGFTRKVTYNQQMEGQYRKPSDNSRLRSLLPNFQFTSIEGGIAETAKWFLNNYEECRK